MTALTAGTRLGPYAVLEPIGAGGMGEVYKASDTRLDRIVAVKVLPRHWAANEEMRQRFEREAQTLGSMNHPHICVLYDIGSQDGIDFLVMEYLEGETLAARLERGAVGLDEAMKLGLEIADALDRAHRRGIVHRDLKPSNVMLTKSGTKLLDFGLAKWAAPTGAGSSVTQSPTALPTGKDVTTPGTMIGTLQYMAPEQLEGLEADSRTDIFAFGALLHEMITGKKAFEGKSRVLLIAAIATSEPPPLSTVEPAASRSLDHVVKTCLEKEPADRWQTARDLLAELEWVAAGGDTAAGTVIESPWKRQRVWLYRALLAAAGLLAGVGVASAAFYFRGTAASNELRFRVPIQLTAETNVAGGNGGNPGAVGGYRGVSGPAVFNSRDFAVSPDGRSLAFVARQANNAANIRFLYVRPVGAVTPQKLEGTENAQQPFWSADGRSIAFVVAGKLKRLEAAGGPPQEICDATGFYGGTWNSGGVILFGSAQGLQRVPAEGGKKPEPITHLAESEAGHFWPQFLPDGKHYLYTVWSSQAANRAILAGSLDAPDQKTRVLPVGSNAAYSEPGYLVFHRETAVYAQPFNPGTLIASGEPTRIANEITFDGATGFGTFSVSPKGTLAYFFGSDVSGTQTGASSDLSEWQLSWFTRTAQFLKSVGPPGVYRGVEAFSKTDRVAVHRHDTNGGDIVVFELGGSNLRLTVDAAQHNSMPIWSPDGTQIVFASLRKGKWGLYQKLSSGAGMDRMLYESELPAAPMSWSPDGKRIVFWTQDSTNAGDLWVLTLEDDKAKAEKLIATPFNETHGQISPDGKWIAFTDNSKDNKNEIYVQSFPVGNGKFQISDNGGDWPRWKGDSKELFYQSLGNPGAPGTSLGATAYVAILYSIAVKANGTAIEKEGLPKQVVIFPAINIPHSGGSYYHYAVSPDGERFLVPQYAPTTAAAAGGQIGPDTFSGLTVAINWASSLKK